MYVGKAKHLRKRVSSYFKQTTRLSVKIARLVEQVSSIDYVATQNEEEALVLENQFIKAYHPKYNTQLRDSKTYPYLKIDLRDPFPRLIKTRLRLPDKALYYGPFVSGRYLEDILTLVRENFLLRRCKKLPKKKEPCLYYHMSACVGPCIGKITQENYRQRIREVRLLLEGKYSKLLKQLTDEMALASDSLEFERAQKCKDRLEAVKSLQAKQRVEDLDSEVKADIFIVLSFQDQHVFSAFRIREGCIVAQSNFDLSPGEADTEPEMLVHGIEQYYGTTEDWPDEIVTELSLSDEDFIKQLDQKKVRLAVVSTQVQLRLVEMLRENAYHALKRQLVSKQAINFEEAANQIKKELLLSHTPRLIAGVDISHFGDSHIVASMVSFRDGVPEKSLYRKFNIRSVPYNDDVASIREVVYRIFRKSSSISRPDLLLIDGGKGQLGAALEALALAGVVDQDLVALAKKEEILYLPANKEGVKLDKNHVGLKILQQVRDEAHRFALNFQKTKRTLS